MRVLFLTHRLPYAANRGESLAEIFSNAGDAR